MFHREAMIGPRNPITSWATKQIRFWSITHNPDHGGFVIEGRENLMVIDVAREVPLLGAILLGSSE